LIADDEPSIATALEFLLARRGYDVRVATDGDQALALVASYRPDVLLLDVMMPKKSGFEVCRRVRERPDWQPIKIVMLSAKAGDADVRKGVSLGADRYLAKPFSTCELIETLDHVCSGEASGG
jgi:DNA-binding response OmpR family regulator